MTARMATPETVARYFQLMAIAPEEAGLVEAFDRPAAVRRI